MVYSKGSGECKEQAHSKLVPKEQTIAQCIQMYILDQECLSHTILWVDIEKYLLKLNSSF